MARATPGRPSQSPRSETADRYLETIYYIEHEGEVARPGRLADWLGVSAPTVTVSLQRLERDGWLSIQPDRSVRLSDRGENAAADIVRRHRILERWLTDVLGLDWVSADREAAALAHAVSPVVLRRIDGHLMNPTTCPHGNVIPGRKPPRGGRLVRLGELAPGTSGTVARISEVAEREAPQLLAFLDRHGVVPGARVRLARGTNSGVETVVQRRAVRVPAGIASAVWVARAAATGQSHARRLA